MEVIDLSERHKYILVYMDVGVEYSTEQVAKKKDRLKRIKDNAVKTIIRQ